MGKIAMVMMFVVLMLMVITQQLQQHGTDIKD